MVRGGTGPGNLPPTLPLAGNSLVGTRPATSVASSRQVVLGSEIYSGKTLNELLTDLTGLLGRGARGRAPPLDPLTLPHINLRPANAKDANFALLKGRGRLTWPATLRNLGPAAETRTLRDRLEARIAAGLGQAGKGEVARELVKGLRADTARMLVLLKQDVINLSFREYMDARRYLLDLDAATTALSLPDAAKFVKGEFDLNCKQVRTVKDLVEFMTTKGLVFAPAVAGDESAYLALHRAMTEYAQAISSTVPIKRDR
jgi:hypothetical protein